jgi:hypothetical protein
MRPLALTDASVAARISNSSETSWDLGPADLFAEGSRIIPSSVGVAHEFSAVFDLLHGGRTDHCLPRTVKLSDPGRILSEIVEDRHLVRAGVTVRIRAGVADRPGALGPIGGKRGCRLRPIPYSLTPAERAAPLTVTLTLTGGYPESLTVRV